MKEDFKDFLGTWELIPEENHYEAGQPPKSGTYTISHKNDTILQFDMSWVDEHDTHREMTYDTMVDDTMHPYENPAIADYVKTTLQSPTQLESRSYKAEKEIAYSLRELRNNGQLLFIIQSGFLPNGQAFSNTSLYRKR